MRAIGFPATFGRKQQMELIEENCKQPKHVWYYQDGRDPDGVLAQYDLEVGRGIGLSVLGSVDEQHDFYPDFWYPYMTPEIVSSSNAIVTVDKRVDNNSYSGQSDDLRLGVTVIYRLLNTLEYRKKIDADPNALQHVKQKLLGLCLDGHILMPIHKPQEEIERGKRLFDERQDLVHLADTGDENAAQKLSALEADTTDNALNRMQQYDEDYYSVVDTVLMPHGVECELYSILGEIKKISYTANNITLDQICRMTVEINSFQFEVGINVTDLVGEPAVGRRFKGIVWMLGTLEFPQNPEDHPGSAEQEN